MSSSGQKPQQLSQLTFPVEYQYRERPLKDTVLDDLRTIILDTPQKTLECIFESYSDSKSQELQYHISAIRRASAHASKYLDFLLNGFNEQKYLSFEDLPHLVKDLFVGIHPKMTPNMKKVFQSTPLQPKDDLKTHSKKIGLSYQATAQAIRELQNTRTIHEYYLINYPQLYLTPLMLFTPKNFVFSSKYTVMSQLLFGGEAARWYFLTYPTTQLPTLLDLLFLRDDNLSTYGIASHQKDTISYSLFDDTKSEFIISHKTLIRAFETTHPTAYLSPPSPMVDEQKILGVDIELAYYLSDDKTASNLFLSQKLDKSEGYLSERKRLNLNRNILYPSYDLSHLGLQEETFILSHQVLPSHILRFFDIFPKTRHIQLSTPINTPSSLVIVTGTLGTATLINHFLSEHFSWSNFQIYSRFAPYNRYLVSPDLFIESSQSWQIDTPSVLLSMDSEK